MSERLTADISRDLRAFAQDMRVEHRNTDAVLLAEAADKLDGLIALLAEAETARDRLALDLQARDIAVREADRLREQVEAERDALREHASFCNAEATKLAEAQLQVIDQRDRLAETSARLEVERDDALALVAACTTRQQRRLAETIRRYEPVIEAAKAWLAYGWNGSARLSAAIRALGDIPSPAAPEASVLSQLDGAMHSIWLHGNWRWLTKNMTTPEKEATLAAVLRHDRAMKADEADLGGELLTEADWAWWREPAPVEPEGTPDADA